MAWSRHWGLTSFFTPLIDIINSYRGDVGHPSGLRNLQVTFAAGTGWYGPAILTCFYLDVQSFFVETHCLRIAPKALQYFFPCSLAITCVTLCHLSVTCVLGLVQVIKFSGDALTIYFQAQPSVLLDWILWGQVRERSIFWTNGGWCAWRPDFPGCGWYKAREVQPCGSSAWDMGWDA